LRGYENSARSNGTGSGAGNRSAGGISSYDPGADSSGWPKKKEAPLVFLLTNLHPDTAGVKGTDFLLQMMIASYQRIAKERGWG